MPDQEPLLPSLYYRALGTEVEELRPKPPAAKLDEGKSAPPRLPMVPRHPRCPGHFSRRGSGNACKPKLGAKGGCIGLRERTDPCTAHWSRRPAQAVLPSQPERLKNKSSILSPRAARATLRLMNRMNPRPIWESHQPSPFPSQVWKEPQRSRRAAAESFARHCRKNREQDRRAQFGVFGDVVQSVFDGPKLSTLFNDVACSYGTKQPVCMKKPSCPIQRCSD